MAISFRPVSSVVERLIDIQEAVGSRPSPGTISADKDTARYTKDVNSIENLSVSISVSKSTFKMGVSDGRWNILAFP